MKKSHSREIAVVDFNVSAFARTGFRGGLNWYCNIDRNWELLCIVGDPEVNRRRPIRWTSKKSAREPVTLPSADAAPRTTNLCGNLVPAERSEPSNRLRQSNIALAVPLFCSCAYGRFRYRGYLGNGSYPCGRHCGLVYPLRHTRRRAGFGSRRGGAAVGGWPSGGRSRRA